MLRNSAALLRTASLAHRARPVFGLSHRRLAAAPFEKPPPPPAPAAPVKTTAEARLERAVSKPSPNQTERWRKQLVEVEKGFAGGPAGAPAPGAGLRLPSASYAM